MSGWTPMGGKAAATPRGSRRARRAITPLPSHDARADIFKDAPALANMAARIIQPFALGDTIAIAIGFAFDRRDAILDLSALPAGPPLSDDRGKMPLVGGSEVQAFDQFDRHLFILPAIVGAGGISQRRHGRSRTPGEWGQRETARVVRAQRSKPQASHGRADSRCRERGRRAPFPGGQEKRWRRAPAPFGRIWCSQGQIPFAQFSRFLALCSFPNDLPILPDGDKASGPALRRIGIGLALEIKAAVASHGPGKGGRAALPVHHAKAMTARFPDAAAIAALPCAIIGLFASTGRMPVNTSKTCRIRWQAGRLRCRRAIVERRPAIMAEARCAHGCSSFGRTSPCVMVKPARASSSPTARLRVAPSPCDAM